MVQFLWIVPLSVTPNKKDKDPLTFHEKHHISVSILFEISWPRGQKLVTVD